MYKRQVVIRRGRTRRSKLYYLRELRGKKARLRTDVGRQEADRAALRAISGEGSVAEEPALAEPEDVGSESGEAVVE